MAPIVAVFIWLVLLAALLYFDPARDAKASSALWVSVAWLFIMGTRLPSQWLSGQAGQVVQALEEGNPLDRLVYIVLILLTAGILLSRSFHWGAFFGCNLALTAFLLFALISTLWSDYPFVAFKRWFRDLGNYLVILVVLSDSRPIEAVHTVLRRFCYLLIPLSITIIKYYPALGIQYDPWTGVATYAGATTSKNMLGVACLISGLFFFWDTITRWPNRRKRRTRKTILVNLAFIAMTLWLLTISSSATSSVCLALGCLVILAARSKMSQRRPRFLKISVPVCLVLYMALAFAYDIHQGLASIVGRDPTFTGRTDIWSAVLSMHTNPIIGTGYESFWLGPRITKVWALTGAGINEAHNGYLEIYLTLGLAGLFFLGVFLITSYRTICRRLISDPDFGAFTLALWTILFFYNLTESAFRGQLMWVVFLFGSITVLQRAAVRNAPNLEADVWVSRGPSFGRP